jgi:hypothetical protein
MTGTDPTTGEGQPVRAEGRRYGWTVRAGRHRPGDDGPNLARNAARRGFASRSTTGPPPAPASCWSATATRASCRDVLDRGVRGRPGPAAAHPGDGEGRPARKTRSAAIDTSRTARKVSSSSGPWGDTTAITRNTTRARRASAARGQRVNGPPGSRRVLGTGVCASSGMRFTIARCRHTRYPVGGLPRRKLDAGLAGGRLPRSGIVRISSYFRSL